MTSERINILLAIGDRLVLWTIALGFAGAVGWLALDVDRSSPTLIAPACLEAPVKGTR